MSIGMFLVWWGLLTAVFCGAAALDHWMAEKSLDRVQHAVKPRIRGGRWV